MRVVFFGVLFFMSGFPREDAFHFPEEHPVILLDFLAAFC